MILRSCERIRVTFGIFLIRRVYEHSRTEECFEIDTSSIYLRNGNEREPVIVYARIVCSNVCPTTRVSRTAYNYLEVLTINTYSSFIVRDRKRYVAYIT